ncbi:MAG: DUF1996 domain-containing protein [Actinobacteria bacterium]|nr:MAG: DUF1996 domain-containing protein [Actinomycetota bacterium]
MFPVRLGGARRLARNAIVLAASLALVTGVAPVPATGAVPAGEFNFVVTCTFSHRLADDPIVFPGQPGMSHLHDFFGAKTTNAFSTYDSLRASSTSCQNPSDTAGYWFPSLLVAGQPVQPTQINAYYSNKDLPLPVRVFPKSLKMVAGDSHATAPQSTGITSWSCGPVSSQRSVSDLPTCAPGETLRLRVRFPDCWDGVNLDSPDHKSHMAYGVGGACPSDHAVAVTSLGITVIYPIRGGPGVTLSSGGTYSGHGDFWNAWNQTTERNLVRDCINAARNCGNV